MASYQLFADADGKDQENNWQRDTVKSWYFAIAEFHNLLIIHKIIKVLEVIKCCFFNISLQTKCWNNNFKSYLTFLVAHAQKIIFTQPFAGRSNRSKFWIEKNWMILFYFSRYKRQWQRWYHDCINSCCCCTVGSRGYSFNLNSLWHLCFVSTELLHSY